MTLREELEAAVRSAQRSFDALVAALFEEET